MQRKHWLCLMSGLFLISSSGCSSGDRERLALIWHKVGDHLDELTQGARQRLSIGWNAIEARSEPQSVLRERVAGRIRSDKGFAESSIEVEVQGTTVILRGQAPDVAGRQRAVELAKNTLGVEEVTDEMGPKE
jgi:osmotically-inducible protein OsmY